ncbi:caspase family protein, partial [Rhodoblastus acidophilus]|uniref:caspase family protein n=1 Tax=Rhodoblastus acidophilus TaxID=1074 RepID=UPI000DAEE976
MTRKAKSLKIHVAAGAIALSGIFAALAQVVAQPAPLSNRIALVVGEAAYRNAPLSSAANDAGLIAQTLQIAGFDVTGAADLDHDGLRKTFREFLDKAAAAGPDATVFIYLAGRAIQFEGENYLAPIDASVQSAANVPMETLRLSDYLAPLSQMQLKARIVVLDAARPNSYATQGAPLAGGLALVEPPNGELIAFNAAPGSVAPPENSAYGVYAQALNEMMRRGGMPIDQVFDSVRLRVAEQTRGAQIPWDESKLTAAPALFARANNAPPTPALPDLRSRPIRDYSVDQAYSAALERDSIPAYSEFITAYPKSAYSARVRALLAVRREALTWRRARSGDSPESYWTYLQRYPRGPHAEDARRRLTILRAELAPPPRFAEVEFEDAPPPPDWEAQEETVYFRRPYVEFSDEEYGPPPPRVEFLPPPVFYDAPPPPPPRRNLLPLPLAAAPLLFAIPAVRQGLFHAPAPVQMQNPAAQQYYDDHARRPPPPQQPGPGFAGQGAPGVLPPQPGQPQPPQGEPPRPGFPPGNGRPLPPSGQQPQGGSTGQGGPQQPGRPQPQGESPRPDAPQGAGHALPTPAAQPQGGFGGVRGDAPQQPSRPQPQGEAPRPNAPQGAGHALPTPAPQPQGGFGGVRGDAPQQPSRPQPQSEAPRPSAPQGAGHSQGGFGGVRGEAQPAPEPSRSAPHRNEPTGAPAVRPLPTAPVREAPQSAPVREAPPMPHHEQMQAAPPRPAAPPASVREAPAERHAPPPMAAPHAAP